MRNIINIKTGRLLIAWLLISIAMEELSEVLMYIEFKIPLKYYRPLYSYNDFTLATLLHWQSITFAVFGLSANFVIFKIHKRRLRIPTKPVLHIIAVHFVAIAMMYAIGRLLGGSNRTVLLKLTQITIAIGISRFLIIEKIIIQRQFSNIYRPIHWQLSAFKKTYKLSLPSPRINLKWPLWNKLIAEVKKGTSYLNKTLMYAQDGTIPAEMMEAIKTEIREMNNNINLIENNFENECPLYQSSIQFTEENCQYWQMFLRDIRSATAEVILTMELVIDEGFNPANRLTLSNNIRDLREIALAMLPALKNGSPGRVHYKSIYINTPVWMYTCMKRFQDTFNLPNTDIELSIGQELNGVLLKTEQIKIRQILNHMLLIAVNYGNPDKQIKAEIRFAENCILSLSISYIGNHADKPLEDHYRLYYETQAMPNGKEVALQICSQLIKTLGGTIDIQHLYNTTTYNVRLPYAVTTNRSRQASTTFTV